MEDEVAGCEFRKGSLNRPQTLPSDEGDDLSSAIAMGRVTDTGRRSSETTPCGGLFRCSAFRERLLKRFVGAWWAVCRI